MAGMNIHSRATRLGVSALVFLIVLVVIVPHLMDVEPPRIVEMLVMPGVLIASLISLPCHNIGTLEHPICEGTPIDLFIGLGLILIGSLFYPAVTYLLLSLLSKMLKHNVSS